MNIIICSNDQTLVTKLKKEVDDFFFPVGRFHVVSFTREEMEQKLQESQIFCDLLIVEIEAKESTNIMKLIRKVKAIFPKYQLIGISREMDDSNYYPELFELNLLYYIYEDKLKSLLPRALGLALQRSEKLDNSCLICKSNHQILKIPFEDIIHIERERHTTKVYTKDNCYHIRRKLNELEGVLAKYPALMRCHMSFFVNYDYAVAFGNKKFEMRNGDTIPVSRKYYQSVKKQIMEITGMDRERA